jgi:hypothetical protein
LYSIWYRYEVNYFLLGAKVADPHHFTADPDPAFYFNTDSDLIKVCWYTEPPDSVLILQPFVAIIHGPLRLNVKPQKLLNYDLNADPDPAFHSNTDPDSASKNNADPDLHPCLKPSKKDNFC